MYAMSIINSRLTIETKKYELNSDISNNERHEATSAYLVAECTVTKFLAEN